MLEIEKPTIVLNGIYKMYKIKELERSLGANLSQWIRDFPEALSLRQTKDNPPDIFEIINNKTVLHLHM